MAIKMQFSVTNQCPYTIYAFHSNILYDATQLGRIINPRDVVKKAAYEYFWNSVTDDSIVHQIRNTTNPYMQFIGLARPDGEVDMFNMARIPQYLYVFFMKFSDKKAELWYHLVDAKEYFNQYDTMAVYQYIISMNTSPEPNVVAESDENTGTLLVKYYDPGQQIEIQKVDWVPTLTASSNEWQYPLVVLFIIILMIVGIVVGAAVLFSPNNKTINYVTNHSENYEKVTPQYLS
jgi:hypothetical protein